MKSSNLNQKEGNLNRRIARNTIMLYFRMFFSMIVSLYTSRVILEALGVEDFGIYTVVGGTVIMLGFLNNAMAASTQRFLTFELGKSRASNIRNVFNMSLTIHIIIAIVIFIIAETVGLWFINSELTIPKDRYFAMNWIYQFSILAFLVSVITVPFNALIIANEKMKVFAVVGVLEVLLKLVIVFIVISLPFDKLITYGLLVFIVAFIIGAVYLFFCKKTFEEVKSLSLYWERKLFYEMGNFASWNLLGVGAGIGYNQGVNILLNIFFGPAINAARGIAFQVQGAVNRFVTSFQVAVNPSITKMYAHGEKQSCFELIFSSSKFSFYLVLILTIPLLLQTEQVLNWWLIEVPEYSIVFTQLILVDILIGSLSGPLQILAQATGKIRRYQVVVSGVLLLNLPTSYFFLEFGYSPETTIIISIVFSILALLMRLRILHQMVNFPSVQFLIHIFLKLGVVASLSFALPFIFKSHSIDSFFNFIIILFISFLSTGLSVFFLGLNKKEKNAIYKLVDKLKMKFQIFYNV